MVSNQSHWIVSAILGLALALTGEAKAGIDYTLAGVEGLYSIQGDPDPHPYADYWNQGGTEASASGSVGTSSASASISLLINPGIRLSTRGTPDISESTSQAAVAQWRDIIRLSGVSELPDAIRVTISVTGSYRAERRSAFSKDEVHVVVSSFGGFQEGLLSSTSLTPEGIAATANNVPHGFSAFHYSDLPGGSGFETVGARDFSYDTESGAMSWKADFMLPYAPLLGGYSMNLLFTNLTRAAFDEDMNADFGNTFRLTDVTLADGSPLPGTPSFDSGFRLQAVPEPSNITMLSTGVIMLLGYGWSRRRLFRAA